MKPENGTKFGRWVVKSQASPLRLPSQSGARSRSNCRCVCGVESAVFNHALKSGHSRGCPSVRCLVRWQIVGELHKALDATLARQEELDTALLPPAEAVEPETKGEKD